VLGSSSCSLNGSLFGASLACRLADHKELKSSAVEGSFDEPLAEGGHVEPYGGGRHG
jgi:hypothetical protein